MAKTPYRILGIDLGGCMSGNSAYIFAEVSGNAIRIIEALKEPKHKAHTECEAFLTAMMSRREVDAVAVDAPLGLPRPLYDSAFRTPPREGSGEILNPYLYRYTDYWLWRTYGLKPMPPAGDRIGRLTARMVSLLQRLDYRFPTIAVGGKRLPLYEVYPKQVAHALGEPDYKKASAPLLKKLNADRAVEDEHLLDALLCCYAGARVLEAKTVQPVENAATEGWCFPVVEP